MKIEEIKQKASKYIGATVKCLSDKDTFIITALKTNIYISGDFWAEGTDVNGGSGWSVKLYDADNNKWAEILQPSKQPQFKVGESYEQTEDFKQGDEVEVDTITDFGKCEILFIYNDFVFVKTQQHTPITVKYKQLRKPIDKDKEKAKELMKSTGFSSDIYKEMEQMLLEMAKWARENK